jgi:hypothetical protein
VLTWLQETGLAQWVQVSLYGWAIMLTFHAVGTATAVGVNFVAGLRLVGLFPKIPYTAVGKLINLVWVAFAINLISGFSLFASNAVMYVQDMMFVSKLIFIAIGLGATYHLQKLIKKDGANWDAAGNASAASFKIAVAVLVLWALVIIVARLIAYL